jgi:hypothetical protein
VFLVFKCFWEGSQRTGKGKKKQIIYSFWKKRWVMEGAEKSNKDKIIELLSQEAPLSIKKIYYGLKKSYSFKGTYQAVHKLVKQMTINKVLSKENGVYSINREWIEEQEKIGKKLKEQLIKQKIPSELKENESVLLKFSSILELGEFLINHLFFYENKKKKSLCLWRHIYSVIGLPKELNENLKKAFKESEFIIIGTRKTPVEEFFATNLKKFGAKKIIYKKQIPTDFWDYFVIGDYVCQVHYDNDFMKLWDKQNNKKSMESFDLEHHLLLMQTKKTNFKAILTKNEFIAEELRKKYL